MHNQEAVMTRGLTGSFVPGIAGGLACQAFVPNALPPRPPLQIDGTLLSTVNEALLALGRLDAIGTLLPDAHLFLYSYVRKEAVMSSQIEGTQSSLSDLMMFEMKAQPGVPLDDVREVSCYVNALNLGIQRIREGIPISYRLVSELHDALMTSGRGVNKAPGEFRRNQVWIGGSSADQAVFIPPPPNVVPDCWADLEKFLNDVPEKTDPVVKAALAHVQFETIHPFMDGNGRLGRLLIPLILVRANVLHEPLLYVSVFLKKHRQIYYERLQQVRLTGDWEGWLQFFAEAIRESATGAVEIARRLYLLRENDRQRVIGLGRLSGSALQVMDAFFQKPIINVNGLVERTGLTPATVNKVLGELEGKLSIVEELTGQKRNRVYIYKAYIDTLNDDP
jgi:Fic family protein